jgi:hypothetical protein
LPDEIIGGEFIIYGSLPIAYTRACFGETGVCGECGKNKKIVFNNTRKGFELAVRCEKDAGFRTICDVRPVCLAADIPDVYRKRIITSGNNYCKFAQVIKNIESAVNLLFIYEKNIK